jgi:hypothetical protein
MNGRPEQEGMGRGQVKGVNSKTRALHATVLSL